MFMKAAARTRVILLAEHNLQLEAWRALLAGAPTLEITSGYTSLQAFAAGTEHPSPAACLVDIRGAHPDEVARLRAAAGEIGMLILVERYLPDEILLLLKAGATGVLERNASVPDLVSALIAVGRGEFVLPPAHASTVLSGLIGGKIGGERTTADTLTDREMQVLALLSAGLTNKAIAQRLFISVRTVEAHLRNIYNRLGVNTRTEAAIWGVEHGYGEADLDQEN